MKCGKGLSKTGKGKCNSCPVASETSGNALNGGINGGRICWIIAETCCNGDVSCSDLHRKDSCFSCEFRYKVTMEEGLLNVCKATGLLLEKLNLISRENDLEDNQL